MMGRKANHRDTLSGLGPPHRPRNGESLSSNAPSIPDASTTTTTVGASWNPPASEAPTEGQYAKTCRDSEAHPAFGVAEAPHDIVSA